ncbi:MAG: glycosyl hydrolase 53 family protein, partial [Paludibacteraceae bacterium]|nr:glycosyl hydrolase 53 family protein [Paludibacteraceae bacterium]
TDDQPGGGDVPYPDHSGSRQFLRGGDLTMVNYIEDFGAKFRYEDGTEADVFDILSNYGVNFARLRLYNAPGTAVKNALQPIVCLLLHQLIHWDMLTREKMILLSWRSVLKSTICKSALLSI